MYSGGSDNSSGNSGRSGGGNSSVGGSSRSGFTDEFLVKLGKIGG